MRIELTPAGKLVLCGLLAIVVIGAVITQGPDARRYLKMKSM